MNLCNHFSTLWKRATLLLQWWKSGLGPVSGVLGFLRRGAGVGGYLQPTPLYLPPSPFDPSPADWTQKELLKKQVQ